MRQKIFVLVGSKKQNPVVCCIPIVSCRARGYNDAMQKMGLQSVGMIMGGARLVVISSDEPKWFSAKKQFGFKPWAEIKKQYADVWVLKEVPFRIIDEK